MNAPARQALTIAAALAVTACGGIGQTPPAQTATDLSGAPAVHRNMHANYRANQTLVFESDFRYMNIYQADKLASNPAPIATIVFSVYQYPLASLIDKKGTLYVAITGPGSHPASEVAEFPKGSTTPNKTITDGILMPWGLAMDKKTQTLYVSNTPATGLAASITVYPYGATSPSETISGQGLEVPLGLALDKHGNLYIADSKAGKVFEVAAGTTTVTSLDLQDLTEPIGAAIDEKAGYLWITDGLGNRINVYKLGGSTTPVQSITGFGFPYAVSVENKGDARGTVVVSDYDTSSFYAFAPGSYTPYATVNNGVMQPNGLLITKQ
jgi:sugar lactone lactonase YvrE